MAKIIIHPQAVRRYTELSWDFSYQSILQKFLLNEEEVLSIKHKLQELYESLSSEKFIEQAEDYFKSYCNQIKGLKIKERTREEVFSSIEMVIKDLRGSNKSYSSFLFGQFMKRSAMFFIHNFHYSEQKTADLFRIVNIMVE